jgi:hypothetical protein
MKLTVEFRAASSRILCIATEATVVPDESMLVTARVMLSRPFNNSDDVLSEASWHNLRVVTEKSQAVTLAGSH